MLDYKFAKAGHLFMQLYIEEIIKKLHISAFKCKIVSDNNITSTAIHSVFWRETEKSFMAYSIGEL